MTTYRLGSSGLVHTPGIIAWAINGYAFPRDRKTMMKVIGETFPSVPAPAIEKLLSKAVPYAVEDETVVFTVEEDS